MLQFPILDGTFDSLLQYFIQTVQLLVMIVSMDCIYQVLLKAGVFEDTP